MHYLQLVARAGKGKGPNFLLGWSEG